jgi:hypothetical protein
VASSGDVSVLVLPALASCALTADVGARTGSAIAPIGGQQVLVVGGQGNPVPDTYLARLDTGAVTKPAGSGLTTPRTDASVTAFGAGALVAGGTNADGDVLANAEVFDPASGGFGGAGITLSEPRTRQGAVVLASGQTLLVGGLGSGGAGDVLSSLELVDPVLMKSIAEGVGVLQTARRDPTVLRLASGEILVAGGFDGAGNPVQTLEWFEPDATPSQTKQPLTLAQGKARAFVALQGGGALAVLTPPVPTPSFQNVWVVDATGAPDTATPIAGTLAAPVLFGGAGGAPILWTGDRWLQWQPWVGAFGALAVLDDVPAQIGDATASPDPGLALWLDPATRAPTLMRFDVRGAYSALQGPLLLTDTGDTAPDRLPAPSFSVDDGLTLRAGTPGPAVFVTDRTYADVAIDVTAPTGQPSLVALRDDAGHEVDVGGDMCPVAAPPAAPAHLHVERRGASVTWSWDGGGSGTCSAVFATGVRVSVGVRGQTTETSVMRDLSLTRLGDP